MREVKRHVEALEIFRKYRIRPSSQALALIGPNVMWSGLDPESAEIFKA